MQKDICDNCGNEAAHKRGVVIEKDYCDDCVVIVDTYLQEVDNLHTRLAEEWTTELEKLRDIDTVLPDVR